MRHEWTTGALVIDLSNTSGMDAAGTGVVLGGAVRAQRRGQQLIIVTRDPVLMELLSSSGLGETVAVAGSVAAALFRLREPHQMVTPS
jgi:anti-anti-sigma factor